MADSPPVAPEDFCPYVGLQPFTVRDRAYFFGREKEQRVISANLFAAPLTVLYGPSAVGKSSVLQAGVASHLASEPRTAVVYFSTWQRDDYLPRLKAECRRAIASAYKGELDIDDSLPLDDWIARALTQFHGALLLMLDQFEEYLLYHREDDERAFDAELARLVNRQDAGAHVLIGLRDDNLSKLNRFSRRIPNLLGNTLQLRRLTPEAAKRAITSPIDRYMAEYPGARPTRIDATLVDRIIADVQIENVATSVSGGLGGVHASEDRGLVEAAFLQLVLTELWRAAGARPGDRVLDAEILDALGGAKAIVRRHVDREVAKLTEGGREIAAKLFLHLVTPSGAKYALRTEDLVELAGQPADQVTAVLTSLANARLLRRIDPPERYEIFHDAFAVALLEWRKSYLQHRQQEEAVRVAEQRKREELRALTQRRRRQALAASVIILFLIVSGYLVYQRQVNDQLAANLSIARAAAEKSAQATDAALSAQQQALAEKRAGDDAIEARELALKAERARLDGDIGKQQQLLAQQAEKEKSAEFARFEADRYAKESKAKLDQASQTQARLDTLVKGAGDKGYDVSKIGGVNAANEPATVAGATPLPGKVDPVKPPDPAIPGPKPEPRTVTGNYRDIYGKAIAAKDKKQWKQAQSFFEDAIALNGKDSAEPINISGFGNVEPYVPHFYLGVVLRAQNNCAAALKEFDVSEQSGAIQKSRLNTALSQERKACAGKP